MVGQRLWEIERGRTCGDLVVAPYSAAVGPRISHDAQAETHEG
jgi:hypothetical protein